jgi:hypothetical protein
LDHGAIKEEYRLMRKEYREKTKKVRSTRLEVRRLETGDKSFFSL